MNLKQEHFTRAYNAIVAQGKPALHNNGKTCLYRGPNNTKCAFGHLLTDEQYDPDMDAFEGNPASVVILRFGLE